MGRPKSFDRDEALDAAVEVFRRRGFAATSIDDLADGLGVSRPALYREWESKELLYQAALDRYRRRGSGQRAFLAGLAADPARVRRGIRDRLLEIVEEALADPHAAGCLVVDAVCERAHDDVASRDQAAAALRELEDGLARAIAAGVAAGALAADVEPRALARLLVVVVTGLRVVGQARPERRVLRDAVDQVMRLL